MSVDACRVFRAVAAVSEFATLVSALLKLIAPLLFSSPTLNDIAMDDDGDVAAANGVKATQKASIMEKLNGINQADRM